MNCVSANVDEKYLSKSQQILVLDALSKEIKANYVVPERAKKYAEHLAAIQNEIDENSQVDSLEFVKYINQQLRQVYLDKHLAVLTPSKYQTVLDMFYDGHKPQVKSDNFQSQPSNPSSSNLDKVKRTPEHKPESLGRNEKQNTAHKGSNNSSSKRDGSGLESVGVLNVSEISRDGLNQTGYLSLKRFDGSKRSIKFLKRVMSTFTESDNVIIDLRESGGGDAEAVEALSSYFFSRPTHLTTTTMPKNEQGNRIQMERWTEPNP